MGLRKKIAVSGKYKGTECEDGAVYYESVWWSLLSKHIILKLVCNRKFGIVVSILSAIKSLYGNPTPHTKNTIYSRKGVAYEAVKRKSKYHPEF